jgi:putative ribonucleoside diphosphate reductase beta chain|nr:MAG TPA: hypothetical protein [Caudoviricetes sp.]
MSEKIEGSLVHNGDRNYKQRYVFLGEPLGLADTVNTHHPELKSLYRKAISQVWSDDEFDFTPCLKEFNKKDDNANIMVDTISFQWLADSVVSHALLPLFAPFFSNTEAEACFAFNTYCEVIHAFSYSEIVRNAFSDPEEVLRNMSTDENALARLAPVAAALDELEKIGHLYSQGKVTKDEVFPVLYKGMTAVYLLERINFIASFAITFGLGEMGMFLPIANCVKKICADEIGIHAEVDNYCLRHMRKEMHYWQDWKDNKQFQQEIIGLIDAVEESELTWTDFIFKDRTIVGLTPELVKDWVRFNVQMLKQSMDLPFEVKVKENPLPWMNNWLSLNKFQNAPQEIEKSDYAVGAMRDDLDDGEDFDV